MSPRTPQDFIEELRAVPELAAAVVADPVVSDHMDALAYGIDRITELSAGEGIWLDRFDKISAIVNDDRLSRKEKLLAIARAMEPWHAQYMRSKGH
jgi:hypothetical protein